MSGKPYGEVPKEKLSLTIDKGLSDLLNREKNKSQLIEELVRSYYSKSLELLKKEEEARQEEERIKKTRLMCLECSANSPIPEWKAAKGLCPRCGDARFSDYVRRKYGVIE